MSNKFSTLDKFDAIENAKLNNVNGGFNRLAYQLGSDAAAFLGAIGRVKGVRRAVRRRRRH
ncbi:hypothetical protein JOC36_001750 [Weissella uvarum]|uniref:hypothetical protein n=1 Tax=Weissella uvarum TaxID=1479233 RepID=UPI001961AD6A|nr:hypothetical protein [Weissella uvarum]MBM7618146.1 hypothetical protein [Weissella uvarum]MCM0595243.1 hypothetical protein [Weissella uvarum]